MKLLIASVTIAAAVLAVNVFSIPNEQDGKQLHTGGHGFTALQVYCNSESFSPSLYYGNGEAPSEFEIWKARRWASKYRIDCLSEGWGEK